MSYIGTTKIGGMYLGSTEIMKAYLGTDLVYQKITGPQYVKDGLVFWLDGIDKGPDNTAWVEKIHGYTFTNNGATFNTDHVYFDGVDDYLSSSDAQGYSNYSNGYTIEVVFENENGGGAIYQPKSGNYYIAFYIDGYNTVVWQSGRGARATYTVSSFASVSISQSRALANGIAMMSSGSSYISNSDSVSYIGRRNSSITDYFNGKVYCIRIYNRNLTESEVLANFAVDVERFNLTTFGNRFYLSGYDSVNYSATSITNPSNAYTELSSSNYCQIATTTGANAETYVDFTADISSIPAEATNISVSCSIKAMCTNASYLTTKHLQLYSGTTAKGDATAELTTTSTNYTISGGTWTRAELANMKLRAYAQRGTTNTSTTAAFRIYGVVIDITYSL